MALTDILKSLYSSDKKDQPLYGFKVTDEADEVVFLWYVMDANYGFSVFRYDRPQERNTKPSFQQWFENREIAIEYCVDQGRAEKLARGL